MTSPRYAAALDTGRRAFDPIAMIEGEVIASVLRLPAVSQARVLRAIADRHSDLAASVELHDVTDRFEEDLREADAEANGWWPEVVLGSARAGGARG